MLMELFLWILRRIESAGGKTVAALVQTILPVLLMVPVRRLLVSDDAQ